MLHALRSGRISHAYLISGGKAGALAEEAAALLLCREQTACGDCPACALFRAGTHPDLIAVRGEKSVGVNEVRAAAAEAALLPRMGVRRVVLIENARKMTAQAQNALLKTLEEPPANVVFLLTGPAGGLLATVRSRCVCVRADATRADVARSLRRQGAAEDQAALIASVCPTEEEALAFYRSEELQRHRADALSAAVALYGAPSSLFSYYAAQSDLPRALGYQISFFSDAASLSAGGPAQNADAAALLKKCPSTARCLALGDLCRETVRRLEGNANARLCINRLLILAGRLAERT